MTIFALLYVCFYRLLFYVTVITKLLFRCNLFQHDIRMTLSGRRFKVLTSYQRPYNVVLTSCAGWVKTSHSHDLLTHYMQEEITKTFSCCCPSHSLILCVELWP